MKVKLLRKLRKNVKYVFNNNHGQEHILLDLKTKKRVDQDRILSSVPPSEKEKMLMLISAMFELKYPDRFSWDLNNTYNNMLNEKERRIRDRKRQREFLKYNTK